MNKDKLFSSLSNEWETPKDFFEKLNDEFGFTLDPCCQKYNFTCEKYYTKDDDGLSKDWSGEIVYCNPPYGREIGKWVKKCHDENINNNITVVMLIPSRTDTKWFHKYIYNVAEIRFIAGRLKFINRLFPSWREDGNFKISSAPFPSMVVIYRKK
jgi:site-specific DNA-methyltransferase (adenine-specific)